MDTGLRAQWLLGGGLEAQLPEGARRSEGAGGLEEAGQGKERSTNTPANDGGVRGAEAGKRWAPGWRGLLPTTENRNVFGGWLSGKRQCGRVRAEFLPGMKERLRERPRHKPQSCRAAETPG